MAKIEQFSRIINHSLTTSGTKFTVPTSNDHTDETWLSTDLYIGELGVNVADDTVFVRTNNGIVQIGTSASTSSATGSNVWVFNTPNIAISSTYSIDAVTPRSGYFTDLGTSTLRWKNLFLGGASNGFTTINTNSGLHITEATDSILVTNNVASNNAPIQIYGTASSTSKSRPLHLNSTTAAILGSSPNSVTIGSRNITINSGGHTNIAVGASDTTFSAGLTSSIMIGSGNGKTNRFSKQVVVGEKFAVRGISDDGSGQYADADWKIEQSKLRTTDALTYNLATIAWFDPAGGGDLVQVEARILCSSIDDPTLVYSANIRGVFSFNGSLVATQIGTPYIDEWNTFAATAPTCELAADATGLRVKVTGKAATTIQWLCSYQYHRLVIIVP